MSDVSDSALIRVKQSYRRLSEVASSVNSASDKLGASIAPLESAINQLGLGISSWVLSHEWHSENRLEYYVEEVGYITIAGKCGLAIRTRERHEALLDSEESQTWRFNEAPRLMRIRSINKIPDLLEQLVKDAIDIEADIVSQTETVEALGQAILASVQEPPLTGRVSDKTELPQAGTDEFAACLTPDTFALSAAVMANSNATIGTDADAEVPEAAIPEAIGFAEVSEDVAATVRITGLTDSAAAAAKIRRFLLLKESSD